MIRRIPASEGHGYVSGDRAECYDEPGEQDAREHVRFLARGARLVHESASSQRT